MAGFSATLSLKEYGGHGIFPYERIFVITQGQQAKLALIFADLAGRPVTITAFTLKLRLRKSDNSVLVLTADSVDNTKGEVEFLLSSADSASLGVGANQTAELEIFLTATPTTTSFHRIPSAFSVIAQAVV